MQVVPVDDASPCALCSTRAAHDVETLVVLASHVTHCHPPSTSLAGCLANEFDVRLLERYERELRNQPTTASWLMLYREGFDRHVQVHVLDTHKREWTTRNATSGAPPLPRQGHVQAVMHSRLIVLGGCDGKRGTCHSAQAPRVLQSD